MKRSPGVTAAAISVIAASAAFCVYAAWPLRNASAMHGEELGALIALSIFQMAFAIWGIATGTAILRLRRWAWLCALIISALLVLINVPDLIGAHKLIRATTGVPTISGGSFISQQYIHLVGLTLIPFALGVWWLILFTRRSVRAQFAPAAGEGNALPLRSGAVDASAIVLFFGSAFMLFLAVMMPLTALAPPQPDFGFPFRGMLVMVAFFYLFIAAWGIITGVGVVKRRPWGRILIFVTAGIAIAFCVFGSIGIVIAPLLTPPPPDIPASSMRDAIIAGVGALLIPLGIAVWWLVLFTRPRVAGEFAAVSSLPSMHPISSPVFEPQPQIVPATAVPLAAPEIPVSIRVIAVVEIIFGALTFVGPFYSRMMNMKPPLLAFGFLVHGWGVNAFYVVFGIAPVIFGVAILRRRSWALDALIVFLLAGIANYGLMFISPERVRYNSEVHAQIENFTAQIKLPDGSPASSPFEHMNVFRDISLVFSTALFAVLLYFLFTRRRAFREACAAAPLAPYSPAPSAEQGTPQ
ncbi:MAG TPA: hypothetical protein VGR81_00550 [Candidatus Acidoferrales bacterium]|nr:hypothetical protein [Candidatus Acidoferrales bacterium]